MASNYSSAESVDAKPSVFDWNNPFLSHIREKMRLKKGVPAGSVDKNGKPIPKGEEKGVLNNALLSSKKFQIAGKMPGLNGWNKVNMAGKLLPKTAAIPNPLPFFVGGAFEDEVEASSQRRFFRAIAGGTNSLKAPKTAVSLLVKRAP